MSYTPPNAEVVIPMVHPMGPWGFYGSGFTTTAPSSIAWYVNNSAVYQPVLVPTTCVIRRLWWANGITVSASYNVDCGIYADSGRKPGTRLISTGSTAQGTATEVQFVDVTDTTLAPGLYWIALAASSTSATFFTLSPNTAWDGLLAFYETSALALPATATPVEMPTGRHPLCGFATTASP